MVKKVLVACLLLTLMGCQRLRDEVVERLGHPKQEQVN